MKKCEEKNISHTQRLALRANLPLAAVPPVIKPDFKINEPSIVTTLQKN